MEREQLISLLRAMEEEAKIKLRRGEEFFVVISKFSDHNDERYELNISFKKISKEKVRFILNEILDLNDLSQPIQFKFSKGGKNFGDVELSLKFMYWLDVLNFIDKFSLLESNSKVEIEGKFEFQETAVRFYIFPFQQKLK